ncbi:GFA family protein [Rhodobacter sp. SY28-1]|uniref:GFA family protein n=1 Tax=Rhodobacter sp. SY28-1 TaxID=2562317 RepID=UPI0010C08600|nr:GFA family protein [Rhodobacter sp. SY28-1]
MKVDGRCHCGHITFEAEVDHDRVLLCHCSDCQTLSGTAFRVVAQSVPRTFRLLSGSPRIYRKTADSGQQREQAFCPDCGTPIYSAPVAPEPRALGLRVGALRQRAELVPRMQLWVRSAPGWLSDIGAIPSHETQPAFGADGSFRK